MKERINFTGREICGGKQQNPTTTMQIVLGIRLWFLPGVAEVLLEMTPELGEARFGMDIKRTEEVTLLHPKNSSLTLIFIYHLKNHFACSGLLLCILSD